MGDCGCPPVMVDACGNPIQSQPIIWADQGLETTEGLGFEGAPVESVPTNAVPVNGLPIDGQFMIDESVEGLEGEAEAPIAREAEALLNDEESNLITDQVEDLKELSFLQRMSSWLKS